MSSSPSTPQGDTALAERTRTQPPRLYQVVLLNDDFTTMDFVVAILMECFEKTRAEAMQLTMEIHETGSTIAGIYPREIAEMKVEEVESRARMEGHPFEALYEPAT